MKSFNSIVDTSDGIGVLIPYKFLFRLLSDVILPFLVLRRLDCVIERKKDEIIELYNELKDEVDPTPIVKNKQD